jgi:Mg-chelatase subunit ChlD
MQKVLVALTFLVAAALAQTPSSFSANIVITNDPNIVGTLAGVLSYSYSTQKMDITYSTASISGFRELFDYQENARFVVCTSQSKCEAEIHNGNQIKIHATTESASADTTCGAGGNSYSMGGASAGGVSTIYTTSGGLPCRVVFTNGKNWALNGHTAVNSNKFTAPTYCPEKECKSQLDVIFVMDHSGSVGSTGFSQMKSFVTSVVNNLGIEANRIAVGLKKFGCTSSPTHVSSLTSCKTCIQSTLNSMSFGSYGCTCIACGQQAAMNEFKANGRYFAGSPVPRVQIVITDGYPNQGDTNTWASRSKSSAYLSSGGGATVFAIAVGSATGDAVLTTIASPQTSTLQTKFNVNSFGQMNTILNALTQSVCLDFGTSSCSGCKGFCGCGNPPTCHCADCDDNKKCTKDVCTAAGCTNTAKNPAIDCNDNNVCTADTCSEGSSSADGCEHTNTPCATPNDCLIYTCDPRSGCVTTARSCDDGDPCTADTCVSNNDGIFDSNDCQHTITDPQCSARCTGVTCPSMPCGLNECDGTVFPAVCKFRDTCTRDLTCSKDRCINDVCTTIQWYEEGAGLCEDKGACYDHSCSEADGCKAELWDAASICDDHKKCTLDSCNNSYVWPASFDKGADYKATREMACIHEQRTCDQNDVCHDASCDEVQGDNETGCFYPIKDCLTDPRLNSLTAQGCYDSLCTIERGGCFLELKADKTIDACGFCDGSGTACVYNDESTAAMGGLAIASIVIAAVAVGVALLLVGGTKGYDLIFKGQRSLAGAQSNPTYDAGSLAGQNPLYDAEMK